MTYVFLRKWSGAFEVRGVVPKIRRVIQAQLDRGECVCVMDDGARGLTLNVRKELEADWPASKVRFSRPHETLAGFRIRRPSPRRR